VALVEYFYMNIPIYQGMCQMVKIMDLIVFGRLTLSILLLLFEFDHIKTQFSESLHRWREQCSIDSLIHVYSYCRAS